MAARPRMRKFRVVAFAAVGALFVSGCSSVSDTSELQSYEAVEETYADHITAQELSDIQPELEDPLLEGFSRIASDEVLTSADIADRLTPSEMPEASPADDCATATDAFREALANAHLVSLRTYVGDESEQRALTISVAEGNVLGNADEAVAMQAHCSGGGEWEIVPLPEFEGQTVYEGYTYSIPGYDVTDAAVVSVFRDGLTVDVASDDLTVEQLQQIAEGVLARGAELH